MKRINYFAAALALLLPVIKVHSQEWIAPADQVAVNNPVSFNNSSVREGKVIFEKNCLACHGDPGKNNPIVLIPAPPDPASERVQANTDGGLFYKIMNGRGLMPPFQSTLNSDQVWKVISYIRKFDPRNAGKLIEVQLLKGKILAAINKDSTAIEILAEVQNISGNYVQLTGAPIFIQVKKAFGILDIGKVVTNANGKSLFVLPAGLAGNSEGKADFILTLGDNFEKTSASVPGIKVAAPVRDNPLTNRNVLWSTNDRLQKWLLLSYFFVTGLVWITIIYIILQIAKLRKAGQKKQKT